jgi:hypothetical protein
MIEWNAQMVRQVGSVLELTLMPDVSPELIQPQVYGQFAKFLKRINYEYGVPVLLRFMHEMNGNLLLMCRQLDGLWTETSRDYQCMETNDDSCSCADQHDWYKLFKVAMLWSPNNGGGYPWGLKSGLSPANIAALNTNGDGTVNTNDDPYSPYYPGDEYVDWVGISLYNLGMDSTINQVRAANPNVLVGNFGSFYSTYAVAKNKPFMMSETAASVLYNVPGSNFVRQNPSLELELSVKKGWWTNILQDSVGQLGDDRLSRMAAAVWFEEFKLENSFGSNSPVLKDFRLTFNETVKQSFLTDLSGYGDKINYAGLFKFSCSGKFEFEKPPP